MIELLQFIWLCSNPFKVLFEDCFTRQTFAKIKEQELRKGSVQNNS